jgi:hypothetical protein
MPAGLTAIAAGFGIVSGIASLFGAWDAQEQNAQAIKEAKEQREKQAKFTKAKLEISQSIQDRANAIHSVWQSNYLPCELETLNEICAEPDVVANEAVVAQRAIAEAAKIFATKKRKAVYCLAPQQVGQRAEVEFVLSTEQADLATGLVRAQIEAERGRVRLLNAQNLQNRMNIINPGRGHSAGVANGLNALSDLYSGLIKDSQSAIDNAAKTQGRAIASLIDTGEQMLKPNSSMRTLLRGQDATDKQVKPYTSGGFQTTPNISVSVNSTASEDTTKTSPFREETEYTGETY